jgi:hypothetical protein
MAAPRENGPVAPHDQPAKTLTKHTFDFIARCDSLAGKHPWIFFLILVAVLKAGSLVMGVLK